MFHSLFLIFLVFIPLLMLQTRALDYESISFLKRSSTKTQTRQSGSLGGETCVTNSSCVIRECIQYGPKPCNNTALCFCALLTCETDSNCRLGELCELWDDKKYCISKTSRIFRERQGKFTLGACRTLDDCATERDCFSVDNPDVVELCTTTSRECRCYPTVVDTCSTPGSTADCKTNGEICRDLGSDIVICMDDQVAISPSNKPTGTPRGLTFDTCRTDNDCVGERSCLFAEDTGQIQCQENSNICLCNPAQLETCEEGNNCSVDGEACTQIGTDSKICVSEVMAPTLKNASESSNGDVKNIDCTASSLNQMLCSRPRKSQSPTQGTSTPSPGTPTPSPSDRPRRRVCIDAEALSDFSQHYLVFDNHVTAHVLCDRFGSCATPGHMVHYNGVPMMMRTYCDIVSEGCRREVKAVNSPKWKRGLRVESKSPGLKYTAFAARYETRGEERILNMALHVGL